MKISMDDFHDDSKQLLAISPRRRMAIFSVSYVWERPQWPIQSLCRALGKERSERVTGEGDTVTS